MPGGSLRRDDDGSGDGERLGAGDMRSRLSADDARSVPQRGRSSTIPEQRRSSSASGRPRTPSTCGQATACGRRSPALGKVQRRYLDATSAARPAYYGTVEEGSGTAIVTVRVRVENQRLTEAEWYLARADDPGLNGPRQPGTAAGESSQPGVPGRRIRRPSALSRANQRTDRARARAHRQQLLRCDHVA